uniref:Uncharacterized protein n=1 Tax=Meloidogyne floridensis TaxID=298350 RepID=A0A915NEV6_9BILA
MEEINKNRKNERRVVECFDTSHNLWPIRPNEFVPERTFQWERFVYLIINGREKQGGILPNILEEDYLEQIEFLENDIPSRVVTKLLKGWREEILNNKLKINGTRTEGFGRDGLLRFEVGQQSHD